LGGGAVLRESNRRRIRDFGRVIWLYAAPDILWQRVAYDRNSANSRPPLTELIGEQEVR
jgi:shikimate kinase